MDFEHASNSKIDSGSQSKTRLSNSSGQRSSSGSSNDGAGVININVTNPDSNNVHSDTRESVGRSKNDEDTEETNCSTNYWEKFSTCAICKRFLYMDSSPHLLPCLHSVCGQCLNDEKNFEIETNLVPNYGVSKSTTKGTTNSANDENCPSCLECSAHFESTQCLPDIFRLNYFLTYNKGRHPESEAENEEDESEESNGACSVNNMQTCVCCETTEVETVADCEQCKIAASTSICQSCFNQHDKVKVFKKHEPKLKKANGLSQLEAAMNNFVFCKIHHKSKFTLFCVTCDMITCKVCCLQLHKDHRWKQIDAIRKMIEDEMLMFQKQMSDKRELVEHSLRGIVNREEALRRQQKEKTKEVLEYAEFLKRAVDDMSKAILDTLSSICEDKLKKYRSNKMSLEGTKSSLQNVKGFLAEVVKQRFPIALLSTKKLIEAQIFTLLQKPCHCPEREEDFVLELQKRFTEDNLSVIKNALLIRPKPSSPPVIVLDQSKMGSNAAHTGTSGASNSTGHLQQPPCQLPPPSYTPGAHLDDETISNENIDNILARQSPEVCTRLLNAAVRASVLAASPSLNLTNISPPSATVYVPQTMGNDTAPLYTASTRLSGQHNNQPAAFPYRNVTTSQAQQQSQYAFMQQTAQQPASISRYTKTRPSTLPTRLQMEPQQQQSEAFARYQTALTTDITQKVARIQSGQSYCCPGIGARPVPVDNAQPANMLQRTLNAQTMSQQPLSMYTMMQLQQQSRQLQSIQPKPTQPQISHLPAGIQRQQCANQIYQTQGLKQMQRQPPQQRQPPAYTHAEVERIRLMQHRQDQPTELMKQATVVHNQMFQQQQHMQQRKQQQVSSGNISHLNGSALPYQSYPARKDSKGQCTSTDGLFQLTRLSTTQPNVSPATSVQRKPPQVPLRQGLGSSSINTNNSNNSSSSTTPNNHSNNLNQPPNTLQQMVADFIAKQPWNATTTGSGSGSGIAQISSAQTVVEKSVNCNGQSQLPKTVSPFLPPFTSPLNLHEADEVNEVQIIAPIRTMQSLNALLSSSLTMSSSSSVVAVDGVVTSLGSAPTPVIASQRRGSGSSTGGGGSGDTVRVTSTNARQMETTKGHSVITSSATSSTTVAQTCAITNVISTVIDSKGNHTQMSIPVVMKSPTAKKRSADDALNKNLATAATKADTALPPKSELPPLKNPSTTNGESVVVNGGSDTKMTGVRDEDDPDENEEWCSVCADGGELLCCDKCPRAFHMNCYVPALNVVPDTVWSCLMCKDENSLVVRWKDRDTDGGMNLVHKRACERILLELLCHPRAKAFHNPVDTKEYPEYLGIIKNPVDFNRIKSKLALSTGNGAYSGVPAFVFDVQQVLINCYMSNDKATEIYRQAEELDNFLKNLLELYFPYTKTFTNCTLKSFAKKANSAKKRRLS